MQERFSQLYFGGADIPEFDETAALAARPMTLLQRAVYEKMTPIEREIDYLERLHRLPDTRNPNPSPEPGGENSWTTK